MQAVMTVDHDVAMKCAKTQLHGLSIHLLRPHLSNPQGPSAQQSQ